MSENKTLRIKEWYEACGKSAKKSIRDAYLQKFSPKNESSFYQNMTNRNLPIDKILFFAEVFECTVDDLLHLPERPRIRPQRPERGQKHLEFQS